MEEQGVDWMRAISFLGCGAMEMLLYCTQDLRIAGGYLI